MAVQKNLAEEFRIFARKVFLSKETIENFLLNATPGQVGAVVKMLKEEDELRQIRKKEKLFRKAKFPAIKSFEDYDFTQVSFPDRYTQEDIKELGFIEKAQDFVFHGQTGRGKTHLAIAIGVACIEKGLEVRFFTAAELVLGLVRAKEKGRLKDMLQDIEKSRLLILDELGYVPLDIDGARLLFQVISNCYEKRTLIVTTNIEFSKWGTVFGDDKMASAIIDRIVHHGRLIEFEGTSHRMDKALMLGRQNV